MVRARWARALAAAAALATSGVGAARAETAAPDGRAPAEGAQAGTATAQSEAARPAARAPGGPRVHHAPKSVAVAHEPLAISASFEFPHLVRRAVVLYRSVGAAKDPTTAGWSAAPFLRADPGPYVATIPGTAVVVPGVEYTIELELVDGTRESAFASRAAPQEVAVPEDLMDLHERAALSRLEGRRSTASAFAEYVSFGDSSTNEAGDVGSVETADWYFRVEGAYTFRLLRFVDEFSVHSGVVRGRAPRSQADKRKVGVNYAAPSARLRLGEIVFLEPRFLTSVTEEGFAMGAGTAVDIGDPYGSKLRVGFESIRDFGSRFFTQVDLQAMPRLRLSPMIEATDMPHAERFGVRLHAEAAYTLPNGISVSLRGGYQARDASSGGPSGGLGLGYSF